MKLFDYKILTVPDILNEIINDAASQNIDEIYFKEVEDTLVVKYLIENKLVDYTIISADVKESLIRRILIVSGLSILKLKNIQEGFLKVSIRNIPSDIRVYYFPNNSDYILKMKFEKIEKI